MENNKLVLESGDILFRGAKDLLQFGPIGLAALMLVLTVIALLIGKLDAGRERLLRQFMYVGAVCFALSLLSAFWSASHVMHFKIYPNTLVAFRDMPRPEISIDDDRIVEPYSYRLWSDKTAIIDVSNSVNFSNYLKSQSEAVKHQASAALDEYKGAVERTVALTREPVPSRLFCVNGPFGPNRCTSAPDAEAISAKLQKISTTLQDASLEASKSMATITGVGNP